MSTDELVERIEHAREYGFQHGCTPLAERTIHSWAHGYPLPYDGSTDSVAIRAILRGEYAGPMASREGLR